MIRRIALSDEDEREELEKEVDLFKKAIREILERHAKKI
jgi:hypothetical protein